MSTKRFHRLVASADELAKIIGTPSELAVKKQRSELDNHMMAFIAESPLLLLGTVGRDGSCDVSPRGDAPGVAKDLDPQTLIDQTKIEGHTVESLNQFIEESCANRLY